MIDLTLDYIKERELLIKEIKRLREDREQLREVLKSISEIDIKTYDITAAKIVARVALKERE
jgi:hypothetical protein